MEPKIQRKIEKTVMKILKHGNLDEISEVRLRNMAAEKLGVDLSSSEHRLFVRGILESFLEARNKDPEDEEVRKNSENELDYNGDRAICWLSGKRRVTVHKYRRTTLVSIKEWYEKDGKQLPGTKGISLTTKQWATFTKAIPAIEDAIEKLESRLN
ncbi:RNA polymerase II transcriptional coactivator KELP-like [Tasmannia lanceolata]|uniref:RNA polymerase II transcriptional coactivator KELP-like n=1 Tax=Tasmannia lanceolata TaxID=3420 RepID=UPI004062946C